MAFVTRRMQVDIQWGQCDPAGIVFNSRFFEIFDVGSWLYFEAALGVPRQQLAAHFNILSIPLVEAGATFRVPLKFGDQAVLETTISEFRRSSFDLRHSLIKGSKTAVEGYEKRVWAGRDPQDSSRMKAVSVPADVIARFQAG
jgi:4-hydroxybenzoyl-CoA thioesterase